MDQDTKIKEFIEKETEAYLPTLCELINIPNVSPGFEGEDGKDAENARKLAIVLVKWIEDQKIRGLKVKLDMEDSKLSPFIVVTVDSSDNNDKSSSPKTVLLYGHFDKQPGGDDWSQGLGPYKPVREGNKLFGRGSVDDLYATFCAITIIKTFQHFKMAHPRFVVVVEGSEESGSIHFKHFLKKHASLIGDVSQVVALDSGGNSSDQMWITSSLRGCFTCSLEVEVMKNGYHSGDGSIVPCPVQIAWSLLDRVYDIQTQKFCHGYLQVYIPEFHENQAPATASLLGEKNLTRFPFISSINLMKGIDGKEIKDEKEKNELLTKYYLQNTWEPSLAVIGCDGLPSVAEGGNVIVPKMKLKFSVRLPPSIKDPQLSFETLKEQLEKDPPFNARVEFKMLQSCKGWVQPELDSKTVQALHEVSKKFYGQPAAFVGLGGSLPFLEPLSDAFPEASIIATGAIGEGSNIHAKDECLDIDSLKNLTNALFAFESTMM